MLGSEASSLWGFGFVRRRFWIVCSKSVRPSVSGIAINPLRPDHPDATRLLAGVGWVVSLASYCEVSLAQLYGALVNGDQNAAVSHATVVSMDVKLDMLNAPLSPLYGGHRGFLTPENASDLKRVLEKFRKAYKLRNQVAHSTVISKTTTYSDGSEEDHALLRPVPFSMKGNLGPFEPRYEYDASDLDKIADHFRAWNELLHYCQFSFLGDFHSPSMLAWSERPPIPDLPSLTQPRDRPGHRTRTRQPPP